MEMIKNFSLAAFVISIIPFVTMVCSVILQRISNNLANVSNILVFGFVISVFFWIMGIGFSTYTYTNMKNKGQKIGNLLKLAITHNIITFILLTFFIALIISTKYGLFLSLV
jgi:hypothetical protein